MLMPHVKKPAGRTLGIWILMTMALAITADILISCGTPTSILVAKFLLMPAVFLGALAVAVGVMKMTALERKDEQQDPPTSN